MNPTGLLEKIQKKYSIQDVQDGRAEAVSVVALDDLGSVIEQAIDDQTSALKNELDALKSKLAEAAKGGEGGGGLEQAAAEAALEAEAKAMEAKAEAEQRAQAAEEKAAELEARVKELEGQPAGDPAAEARAKDLEAEVAMLKAEADRVAGLEAEIEELKSKLGDLEKASDEAAIPEEDAGPVTDDDRKQARRIAEAFLEEVFSDDEDKTNAAIKAGNFEDTFVNELKTAKARYIKRVKAHVRADTDHWAEVMEALKGREW